MNKSRVFILYTGGTIGMAPEDPDNPASPLVPQPLEKLKAYVPGLEELSKSVELTEDMPFEAPLDSSDVKPMHWKIMARRIQEAYQHCDGIVVLHGTDTMAYTASALSFMLHNLDKPVVITGSQLPISHVRTDAVWNFTNAIHIAAYKAFDLPRIPEVVICFQDRILRGCRATKVSSRKLSGFDSPNFPALGSIGEHIEINIDLVKPRPPHGTELRLDLELEERIVTIVLSPAISGEVVGRLLDDEDLRGVVIKTFGAGNAPNDAHLLHKIEQAVNRKKVVLNVSTCLDGTVEMGRYAASTGLLKRGVVSGLDMTTEAAEAKLMWVLGTHAEADMANELQIGQRGEQSENLFDLRFGEVPQENAAGVWTESATPDGRFKRANLSRAIVRISGLRFEGVAIGTNVQLNVFMNKKSVSPETLSDDESCVTSFPLVWKGKPLNPIRDITHLAKSLLRQGPIMLSVAGADGVATFWHDGVYLALFSKASFMEE